MTASRLVTIFCDRCGMWDDAGVAETAREARQGARRAGWRVGPGKDICPDCVAKEADRG